MNHQTGKPKPGNPQSTGKSGLFAETTGIKSIIRTPKKALLFLVLLAAAVTLLTLVLCVYQAVSGYLAECNQYYHTIAELEYMGEAYPDSHTADPALQASLAENEADLQALLRLPGVLQFDAEDALLGVVPGLTRHDYQVYDRNAAVIVFTVSWWENTTSSYAAVISDALFAWGDVAEDIAYISLPEGTLQPGQNYIMCGHFINSTNNFLLFEPEDTVAGPSGSQQILPGWQPLDTPTVPADSPYRALARVLANRNNGYRVSPVTNLETLRPWQQGELKLIDGRLFTDEEYASDAHVCVISNLLSTVMELSVGDSLSLSLNDCGSLIYSSWCDSLAPCQAYRITGIYYRTAEHPDTLYIPRSAPDHAITMTTGYTLGQFRLDNDAAAAFETAAAQLLPARFKLTLYDEGYAAVSGPYKELQKLALLFLLICLLVVPGILALYSYLFISRQRDSALLQRALGAGRAHVLRGFMASSLAVTLLAAAIGLTAGRLLEGRVLSYVRTLAERLGTIDTRFSSGNLFTVRQLAFAPVTHAGVYLLAAGLFLAFVLLFTAAFSIHTLQERKPRKRKKPRAVHGHTSRLSGRLKYAYLSIQRGGMRTLAVLLLCAVIAFFLGLLTSASDQYTRQLQEIESNTSIRGYATDSLGRYVDGMVVPATNVQKLYDTGLTDFINLTWQVSNLRFIGIPRTADGTMHPIPDPPIPQSGFSVETLRYKLGKEPKWVAANSITGAPAFYYENSASVTWLDGWDESCLTGSEADLCVLSTAMMERNGIVLGDTVRFLCWFEEKQETSFALLDFTVVGSYVLPCGEEIIYTPLGIHFPVGTEAAQIPQREYRSDRRWNGSYDLQWSGYRKNQFKFRSMIFTLRSTAKLDPLRSALEAVPFAQAGALKSIRDYVLIDDADYLSAVQGMQRQIRYMNALFLCLYVVIMLIGAVGAYLLQNSRKAEIALMRALGVGPVRIMAAFLWEQLLLSVTGTLIGVLLWSLLGNGIHPLLWRLIALYELCWITGSIIRLIRALRSKTQELLTEPE